MAMKPMSRPTKKQYDRTSGMSGGDVSHLNFQSKLAAQGGETERARGAQTLADVDLANKRAAIAKSSGPSRAHFEGGVHTGRPEGLEHHNISPKKTGLRQKVKEAHVRRIIKKM